MSEERGFERVGWQIHELIEEHTRSVLQDVLSAAAVKSDALGKVPVRRAKASRLGDAKKTDADESRHEGGKMAVSETRVYRNPFTQRAAMLVVHEPGDQYEVRIE